MFLDLESVTIKNKKYLTFTKRASLFFRLSIDIYGKENQGENFLRNGCAY
jgi:hypothetical protein